MWTTRKICNYILLERNKGAQNQQCYRQLEDAGQNCRGEQNELLQSREEEERMHGKFPRNLHEKRVDKEQSYGWLEVVDRT